MKVRTTRDANKLDTLIQKELGIDIKKYRDKEVEEKVSELIGFIGYAVNTIKFPLMIGLGAYILGFFLLDLVHIEKLIYGIMGLPLMLIIVVLVSALLLVWGIKNSALEVIEYTLDLSKKIQKDVQAVNEQMTDKEKEHKYQLFYKGVLHLITIPVVAESVVERIPYIGWIFRGIIRRILSVIADNRLVFKLLLKSNLFDYGGYEKAAMDDAIAGASGFRSFVEGFDRIISRILKVLQFPILLALGLVILVTMALVWLLN